MKKIYLVLIFLFVALPGMEITQDDSVLKSLKGLSESEIATFLSFGNQGEELTRIQFFIVMERNVYFEKASLDTYRELNKRGLLEGLDDVETVLHEYTLSEDGDDSELMKVEGINFSSMKCKFSIELSEVGENCYWECIKLLKKKIEEI